MFKALQAMTTGEKRKVVPGDNLPEALNWSAKSIKMFVDKGVIEWVGKGGKYGPSKEAVEELKAAEREKAAPAKAGPTARDLDEFKAHLDRKLGPLMDVDIKGLVSDLKDAHLKIEALTARLDAIESKSEGSAPGPKASPSPPKTGR